MIKIVSAQTDELIEHVITLTQEYLAWIAEQARANYTHFNTDELFSGHDYSDLRKKFPGEHVPPYGDLLLAFSGDQVAGCVALGNFEGDICEMRTLFVRPAFRGEGIGKALAEAVIDEARAIGYTTMRLDTLKILTSALKLYHSIGFYDIEQYRETPETLKPYICFLELKLS
jgi:ribosomal protein S18 acetylase RimI-like enzyme